MPHTAGYSASQRADFGERESAGSEVRREQPQAMPSIEIVDQPGWLTANRARPSTLVSQKSSQNERAPRSGAAALASWRAWLNDSRTRRRTAQAGHRADPADTKGSGAQAERGRRITEVSAATDTAR